MKQRVTSSLVMVVFLVVLYILGVLADRVSGWSPINTLGQTICGWLFLIFLLPLIFVAAKEICNIFFKFKAIPYLVVLINMIVLVYAPTLVYFLKYYGYISLPIGTFYIPITITNIFAITLAAAIVFVVINTTILLAVYGIINFKNWVILNLLTGVVSGFFLGTYFFMLTRGFLTLLWLMLLVFGSDIFAYFGGVMFGKHKMSPKISPKKTWEGFGISLVVTVGCGLLILLGFSFIKHTPDVLSQILGVQFQHATSYINSNQMANKPYWWVSMFFITIGICLLSVFGDLAFSWFKRKYRIKDYGNLIPGHGGIIDRIDSHSVVISFYFVLSFFIALAAKTVVFFNN
ncbi:phosphatidate cytidylyltransferase [Ureaplasma ceti]